MTAIGRVVSFFFYDPSFRRPLREGGFSSKGIIDWVNEFFKDRIKKPSQGFYQADYVSLKSKKETEGEVIVVEPDMDPGILAEQNKDAAREIEARMTASWIKNMLTQVGVRSVTLWFCLKQRLTCSAQLNI